MAKPLNFSSLSPRAQAFFADRAAAKKGSKRNGGSKNPGSKSGKGGGS